MNCYFNVMGGTDGGVGSPLTFNASTCYSPAPASGPPPSPTVFLISEILEMVGQWV